MANTNFTSAAVISLHAISQNFVSEIELLRRLLYLHFVEKSFCNTRSAIDFLGWKVESEAVVLLFHCVQKRNTAFYVPTPVPQLLFGHASRGLVAHLSFQAKRSERML